MNSQVNSQGFLASCPARRGQGFLDTWLRRPPGWPMVEALFIGALSLLALVVVDLIVNFALEFPTP